ncbi:MAG: acidic tetraheme cytochrome c3 TmcA [Desulfovibrionales bacterium]
MLRPERVFRNRTAGMVTACLLLLFAAIAFGQDELLTLSDSAFPSDRRPPSLFGHDLHMQVVPECSTCHHLYENGSLVPDADSVGIPCSECHAVSPGNGTTPLILAYHLQCKGCHLERKQGPVGCGECHVRE